MAGVPPVHDAVVQEADALNLVGAQDELQEAVQHQLWPRVCWLGWRCDGSCWRLGEDSRLGLSLGCRCGWLWPAVKHASSAASQQSPALQHTVTHLKGASTSTVHAPTVSSEPSSTCSVSLSFLRLISLPASSSSTQLMPGLTRSLPSRKLLLVRFCNRSGVMSEAA